MSLNGWKGQAAKTKLCYLPRTARLSRFSEKDVRPMGRNASGVAGMRIKKKKDDELISMDIIRKEADIKNLEVLGGYRKWPGQKE